MRGFAAAVLLSVLAARVAGSAGTNEVSFTFDDLPQGGPALPLPRVRALTETLLAGLKRNGIPTVAFVNEKKLFVPGETDARIALLSRWLDGGHELGNHTFSHPSLQKTSLPAFEEDLVRGETVTRLLLETRGKTLRFFRHPFLHTGPSLEVRRAFETFLKDRGYTVAPVTFDNADWMFAALHSAARTKGDDTLADRLRQAYLEYLSRILDFFEAMAAGVVGRPMRHILLAHANELNAEAIDDVAALFRSRGYSFVTLARALEDPAYARADRYAGPNGVSWLERWAYTATGVMDLKKEPDPPPFVLELYRVLAAPKSPTGI